jgi:hypothetical protein
MTKVAGSRFTFLIRVPANTRASIYSSNVWQEQVITHRNFLPRATLCKGPRPDEAGGGRKQTLVVGGETIGSFEHFEDRRWIEEPVDPGKTVNGTLSVRIVHNLQRANAVVSKVEWLEKQQKQVTIIKVFLL